MAKFRQAGWSVVCVAVLGIAWACQETTRPALTRAPIAMGKIAYDISSPPPVQPGTLTICKDTPAGTSGDFTFVVVTTTSGWPSTDTHVIKSGHCETFGMPYYTGASYAVNEDLSQTPGWTLISVTVTTDNGSQELSGNDIGTSGANPVLCSSSPTTGCVLVFHNIPTPPPNICTDQNATNYGGPLPCLYAGKSFTIGPSSMEGAIRIAAGDWVNGGYSFKFNSAHSATTFTVNAYVTISGPCRTAAGQLTGTTDVVTVPLGNVDYSIPASSKGTDWLPTGDANNVASWEGSIVAPANLCGGSGNKLDASKGAVYHATVSQSPASGSLVNFRFKFRDPAAKGKPNTNCLDTSDPNRAKADVCGASWSQTVTDP